MHTGVVESVEKNHNLNMYNAEFASLYSRMLSTSYKLLHTIIFCYILLRFIERKRKGIKMLKIPVILLKVKYVYF